MSPNDAVDGARSAASKCYSAVALGARATKEVKPLSIWKVDTMADRVASHYSENLKLADAIAEKLRSAVGFKLIAPSR